MKTNAKRIQDNDYLKLLLNHPFQEQVFEECIKIQKKYNFNQLKPDKDEPQLDELEFYVTRVGFCISHTLTWIQQLHQAVHFMSDFGYSKEMQRDGIKRSHHLIYNIENYLIRLQSIYDRLLQLTNNVFHLCISDQLVNHSIIVSNIKVARTKIPSLLKGVKAVIKDNSEARNAIVHRHSYLDDELSKIELLYMPTKESWDALNNNRPYTSLCYVRSQKLKVICSKRKSEFQEINSKLAQAVADLFDEMHIQYKKQTRNISVIIK